MHLIIVLDPLWVLSRISGNMRKDVIAIDKSEWFFWSWPRYVDELRPGQSPAPRIAVARLGRIQQHPAGRPRPCPPIKQAFALVTTRFRETIPLIAPRSTPDQGEARCHENTIIYKCSARRGNVTIP